MNEIKGFDELQRNLKVFEAEARSLLMKEVFAGCNAIANEAKQSHGAEAHEQKRYTDRTANLTNSIQALPPKDNGNKITGETVAGQEYAAVVELGGTHTGKDGKTWRTSPYPYMFPALEKMSGAIVGSIANTLKKIKWVR